MRLFSGLYTVGQCTPCLGGYYCPTIGMVTPVDLCDPGYFCKQGANISAPDQGDDANICPEGHYCMLGTDAPEPCPRGTYNNGTGLQNVGQCIDCPAGMYCDQYGLVNPAGYCDEGYAWWFCVLPLTYITINCESLLMTGTTVRLDLMNPPALCVQLVTTVQWDQDCLLLALEAPTPTH